MERVYLASKEILFSEGDLPTVAYLIESGEIEVSTVRDGESLILSKLCAGDLLGEMAVIDDAPRTATAKALTDCVLFQIDRTQISERLASTDPIIRALLEGQLKRYRGALAAMQGKSIAQDDGVTASEALGVGKIRLESQLREALNTGGLDVRYQALLHVQTNKVAGTDTLVRWTPPGLGPKTTRPSARFGGL